jgi:hypothetical protein
MSTPPRRAWLVGGFGGGGGGSLPLFRVELASSFTLWAIGLWEFLVDLNSRSSAVKTQGMHPSLSRARARAEEEKKNTHNHTHTRYSHTQCIQPRAQN